MTAWKTSKLKSAMLDIMTLTNREKTTILISHAISLYSQMMQNKKIPQNQSVVDFIQKNVPDEYKSELSIDLIDDIFSFISHYHMELS